MNLKTEDFTLPERYTIEDRVCRRALSDTYRATDVQTGSKLAVKVVRYPLWLSASEREAHRSRAIKRLRFTAGIEHSAVAKVRFLGDPAGSLVLARDWVAGIPLSSVMRQHGSLCPDEVS